MKKVILYGGILLTVLLFAGCTPSVPGEHQDAIETASTAETASTTETASTMEPTESPDRSADPAEMYLIEDTENNLVSIQLPYDETLSAENMEFIKSKIRNAILVFSDETINLKSSATDIVDKNREYTHCYLSLTSQIQHLSEDWISITITGLYNNKTAAHPVNAFFAINFNPKTNGKIAFSDRYIVDPSLYEKFVQAGEQIILERRGGVWPAEWGDFSEVVCSEEQFFRGLETGAVSFYRTSDEIGFVPVMPFAFGEPLVVTIPGEQVEPAPFLYFTMDDFASIEVGKSTLKAVTNITGKSFGLAMTSYGGFSEYPMEDGKCIRIEYEMDMEQEDWGDWFVVRDIKIVEATFGKNLPTTTDTGSHNPVGFSDYDKYIDFFRDPYSMTPVSEIYTSVAIKTYIQDVRNGKLPLMIPYIENVPMALKEYDHPFAAPVNASYNHFAGSSFTTVINGTDVHLDIYALYEEDAAMAKEMTCPEFIKVFIPTLTNILKFNVGQYNYRGYEAVFEDTAMIAGASRSMLVQQTTDGHEWIYFLLDGCLIQIEAPTGTVTKDWLKDFSIKPVL